MYKFFLAVSSEITKIQSPFLPGALSIKPLQEKTNNTQIIFIRLFAIGLICDIKKIILLKNYTHVIEL